ncbi:hypothetical protein B0G75_13236 [Paraburkholderia sp. BL18I3N2]|nr:hypothetical protein B0G75_13236 [Paraburkholderia sp. BL18I3N2]
MVLDFPGPRKIGLTPKVTHKPDDLRAVAVPRIFVQHVGTQAHHQVSSFLKRLTFA